MIYRETGLPGALVIDPERIEDERGFFARTWCREEFERRGLKNGIAQCSVSFNRRRGTVRGVHYQAAPHEEVKLVRCTRGAIFDVIVDLRAGSPTYRRWFGVELNDENRLLLYVPEGFAHGFQTLVDNAEVFYQITPEYAPQAARGVRWDDPALGIHWPLEATVISARDRAYALLSDRAGTCAP